MIADDGRRYEWVLVKNATNIIGTFSYPTGAMAYVRKSTGYETRPWFSSEEGVLSSWASQPDQVDRDEYEILLAPCGLRWDETTGTSYHPVVKITSG